MIKTLIKHLVYNHSINILFDRLRTNMVVLAKCNHELANIKIGDQLSELLYAGSRDGVHVVVHALNVTIIDAYNLPNDSTIHVLAWSVDSEIRYYHRSAQYLRDYLPSMLESSVMANPYAVDTDFAYTCVHVDHGDELYFMLDELISWRK